MSDLINRAETLEAIKRYFRKAIDEIDGEAGFEYISDACEAILKYTLDICKMIEALPSSQPSLKDAVATIEEFLNNGGDFITSFRFKAKDGALLKTDWGYFEEGLYAIEKYAERRTDG